MNVYWYELKANLKFVVIWLIVRVGIGLLMTSFYPTIAKDLDAFIEIMNNYPEAIRAAFGLNLKTMNSVVGYYSSFPLTFLLICSSIEAMIMGISILSKEERDKTADFLFTKPLSRITILTAKMKAIVTLLLVSNVILFVIICLVVLGFSNGDFNLSTFTLLTLTLFMIQLIFVAIGMLISVILPKVKAPLSISMGVVLGFYTLSTFADDKIRAFIPFKYFDSVYILEHQAYELGYLILLFTVILVATISTYIIYSKKDIHSV